MARKMYVRYGHSVYEDPGYELRHARMASKLLEQDDSMDEVYKAFLLSALNGRDDQWKEKTETRDVIGQRRKANALNGQRRKASALKKQKRNDNVMELDDDCNVEEADPAYEDFLSKLKGMEQSSQLKFEKGGLPLIQAIRCKVNRGCDGDDIVQIDKRQAPSSMDHRAVEGLRKSIHPAQNGEKNKAEDRRKLKKVARQGDHKILDRGVVRLDKDHFDHLEKRNIHQDPGSRKSRKKTAVGDCAVKESDHREKRKIHQDLGSRKSRKKTDVGDCAVKKESDHREKRKIHQDLGSRKSRKKTDVGDCAVKESDHREKRKIHQDLGSRKSRKKTDVGDCAVKKESDHSVNTCGHIKQNYCQISNAKRAGCSAPLKKSNVNYLKGKRDSNAVRAEVEILDGDMIARKRNCNPFIPSIKHATMDEELEGHGLPTASDEFRKEVLKVLRRPFDKEEYKKCREEVRDKYYTFYYPGLQTKLTKFRYKTDKCLIVLRGFFFWLQNLTREGAFKPWLDKECLTVELSSR